MMSWRGLDCAASQSALSEELMGPGSAEIRAENDAVGDAGECVGDEFGDLAEGPTTAMPFAAAADRQAHAHAYIEDVT